VIGPSQKCVNEKSLEGKMYIPGSCHCTMDDAMWLGVQHMRGLGTTLVVTRSHVYEVERGRAACLYGLCLVVEIVERQVNK